MDPKDSIEITEPNLPESNPDEETKVDEPIVNNETGETDTEFLKQGAVKAIIWEDIVAKGYDTVDFAQFLGTFQLEHQIAEGQWTQQKLKEAVVKFKETNSPQFSEQVLQVSTILARASGQKEQNIGENVQVSGENEQKEAPVFENDIKEGGDHGQEIAPGNEEVMMEKVYVQKAEPTVLNQYKDIKITIDDAQVAKGGVFGGDHMRFTIKTEPLGWVVTRKHSEFARLKIVLDKLHPGLVIPNLLKKNEKEKFEDDSNRKRIFVYERFLQDCAQNEDIKATKFFVEFLSISDKAKFVPIKKAVEKVQKVTRLDDLTTIEGEIHIDVRPQVANDSILGEIYFLQADQIYRDIKNLGKKLAGELSQASATIEEISHRYAVLDTIASNYNKKASVGKDKLDDIFGEFSKLIKTWGDSFKTQALAIKKNLVCFYKYAIYESDSFKAMGQARFRLQTEYEKLYVELTTKKEQLFAQGDPSKWGADPTKLRMIPKEQLFADKALIFDLMLPKETAALKQYKQSYGFMNYATCQQLGKIFDSHLSTFINNSSDFIQMQIKALSKMNRDWVGFLTDTKSSETELQPN